MVEGWKDGVIGGGGARLGLPADPIRALVPARLDFVLAGGLEAGNVAEAVALFRPDVVDVSSGIEDGALGKDRVRAAAFLDATRQASRLLDEGPHSPTRERPT